MCYNAKRVNEKNQIKIYKLKYNNVMQTKTQRKITEIIINIVSIQVLHKEHSFLPFDLNTFTD